VGILVMFIGPCANAARLPGLGAEDAGYRAVGYVSISVGAVITAVSAIGIYLVDRKRQRDGD
jgi:hypothetical protein